MKYSRVDKNVFAFAENISDEKRTAFGTTDKTDDINDNLNDNFKNGFGLGKSEVPRQSDFNGLSYTLGYLASYLYQAGIPEYSENQNYYKNSFCSHNGKIYLSIAGNEEAPNKGNSPLISPDYWKDILGNFYNKDEIYTKTEISNLIKNSIIQKELGEIYYTYGSVPTYGLALNGALWNRADYPELWAWAVSSNLVQDETAWQSDLKKQSINGYFSTGNGNTTFRVPYLIRGFLGYDPTQKIGQFETDMIRNITGKTAGTTAVSSASGSGAFMNSEGILQAMTYGVDYTIIQSDFNASRVVPTGQKNKPQTINTTAYIVAKKAS